MSVPTPTGGVSTISISGRGSTFPVEVLAGAALQISSVQAETESEMIRIPTRDLLAMFDSNPAFHLAVMKNLSRLLAGALHRLNDCVSMGPQNRRQ